MNAALLSEVQKSATVSQMHTLKDLPTARIRDILTPVFKKAILVISRGEYRMKELHLLKFQ